MILTTVVNEDVFDSRGKFQKFRRNSGWSGNHDCGGGTVIGINGGDEGIAETLAKSRDQVVPHNNDNDTALQWGNEVIKESVTGFLM